ncbi:MULTISPECIES: hypothetical protein [Pseudomonas]|uniref:hypothetical protein n=1 Tax=Pseudomonas TaxID=286 RepID=UPI001E31198B|nr:MULTISPECIES: hypothetical protein [Pseudomonas]MCQ9472303.1 hypothetical protein [Pseudomonas alliivorans]
MGKHPIPDWLRSQFSRIEDEVRKLGPCGVFTQMRTVTQTYFEHAAAAPQTRALGGELVAEIIRDLCETEPDESPNAVHVRMAELKGILDYRLAPLQAYLAERWEQIAELNSEAVQLKARNAELDQLSPEALSVMKGMVEHCINVRARMGMDEGFKSFDPDEEYDFVHELRAFALSKPAGSEQPKLPVQGETRHSEIW